MAEGVNVRLSGPLKRFIRERSGPSGLYENASEYIRDLIRRDYEADEAKRWGRLADRLRAGMRADASEFVEFDIDGMITEAKGEVGSVAT